jgi:hypothetical protein
MGKMTKKITLDALAASIEELAIITAKGFENSATKKDVISLEQGQEDIKLKLDNVAYRFEVKDLEKRVDRLESKAGIQHRR